MEPDARWVMYGSSRSKYLAELVAFISKHKEICRVMVGKRCFGALRSGLNREKKLAAS